MTDIKRYVIQARLLGLDTASNKRGKETEYAIEVELSDESQYTMYRSLKDIANFQNKMMNKFKVEAGYFKKEDRMIPECPIKQTIFGPQRGIRDDKSFGMLLNYYIKSIPALPAALVKSDLVTNFFSLRASDLDSPDDKHKKNKKSRVKIQMTDETDISGPISLKSYYTVADFMDKKTKFSFKEGATVQLIQKDPSGWWRIDAQGMIGWAPAAYLVPVNASDLQDEEEENLHLMEQDRVGARHISISAYQASRDDELSFVRGAVVKVIKKYIDGWWYVRYNGGEGFVPGAMFRKFDKRQATVYVKKIKRKFTSKGTTRIAPTVKPKWMNESRKKNQVNVVQGARSTPMTCVVPKDEEPSCVEPSESAQRPRFFSTASEKAVRVEDKSSTESQALTTTTTSAPTATTSATTATTSSTTSDPNDESSDMYICKGSYQGNGICMKENDLIKVLDDSDDDWWYVEDVMENEGWAPAKYLQLSADRKDTPNNEEGDSSQNGTGSEEEEDDDDIEDMEDCDSLEIEDCYVVVKDYTKEALDELDVFEGQVVCVIDDSDEDMWYVNVDGKEGWVPSSILQIMTDEDLQTSSEGTPTDTQSNEISADNSELSDDTELKVKSPKQKHHLKKMDNQALRPRSEVIHRSSSPVRSDLRSPPQRGHLSDSDVNTLMQNNMNMDNKTLEELEREAKEAERLAEETRLKAQMLKEKLYLARMQENTA